jgi:hypothetical protein
MEVPPAGAASHIDHFVFFQERRCRCRSIVNSERKRGGSLLNFGGIGCIFMVTELGGIIGEMGILSFRYIYSFVLKEQIYGAR